MHRVLLIAFCLATLVPSLFASQKDKDREMDALIDRAKELSDIRAEGATPFRLKMTFKIMKDDGSVAEGTVTELWLSRAQWRKEWVLGDFRRTEAVMGHKIWKLDSAPKEPEGLNNIPSLLHPMGWLSRGSKAESLQDRTVNGIALRCFVVKTSFGKSESCFDRNGGSLAFHVSPIPGKPNVDSTYLYTEYKKFGDRLLPTSYENSHGQKIRSQGSLQELIFNPELDQTLFEPLAGAKQAIYCFERVLPPTPIQRVDPVAPKSGNQMVTVLLSVGEDGTPLDLRIGNSAGEDFDRAAIRAVSQWKFKPAMCNGQPVEVEISVEVAFVR